MPAFFWLLIADGRPRHHSMFFGRSLHFVTTESPGAVIDRLSAVVLSTNAIAPLRPVGVKDWVDQFAGKWFIGSVEGARFKLGLLQAPGTRFRVRGSVVVIIGEVADHSVDVKLRPPLFILLFLTVFAVVVGGALALSMFGPMREQPILVLPALALALPFMVVGWFFNREAALAEQTLRRLLFANGGALGPRNGGA